MAFCANCGAKLADGVKFCPECGTKVGAAGGSGSLTQGEQATRNTAFAGGILKCPNCGSIVDKLATVCPSCGFKLEGGVANSVKSLLAKLDEIESQRKVAPVETDAKKAFGNFFVKTMTGTMTKDPILDKEIEVINHFAIPTSITEITELFLVALPRIDTTASKNSLFGKFAKLSRNSYGTDSAGKLSDAWLTLLQGTYAKASVTFANEPEFAKLDEMYKSKMKELGIKIE